MAENKKSFILYCDWITTFEKLSDEEAGRLIKHLFLYVNDNNPTPPDRITELVFEPIKQQLKRDLKYWETIKQKRSEAGKASAEKRKQESTNSTHVESVEQKATNPTVNVTVNDTVTVNDNVTVINNNTALRAEQFEKFWDYYEKKGSRKLAKEKFSKLSDEDLELMRKHLPAYLKANPERQFRKDAERYLSNKLWTNGDIEILEKSARAQKSEPGLAPLKDE